MNRHTHIAAPIFIEKAHEYRGDEFKETNAPNQALNNASSQAIVRAHSGNELI